jgi:hypothetical protein
MIFKTESPLLLHSIYLVLQFAESNMYNAAQHKASLSLKLVFLVFTLP